VAAGLRYIRTGFWVRVNSAPQFSGDRPAQGVEACVICHAAGAALAWNGGGRPATWTGPIVNSAASERIHSSPKPEWLMQAQVADFTSPGEVVLDPFAGSGTTLVAAKQLGRRALGFERDPTFHRSASSRLARTREQLGLFRVERGPEPKQASLLVASGASSHGEGPEHISKPIARVLAGLKSKVEG
jgi:site-specific DNA-methyltransferase (adenine-specific)